MNEFLEKEDRMRKRTIVSLIIFAALILSGVAVWQFQPWENTRVEKTEVASSALLAFSYMDHIKKQAQLASDGKEVIAGSYFLASTDYASKFFLNTASLAEKSGDKSLAYHFAWIGGYLQGVVSEFQKNQVLLNSKQTFATAMVNAWWALWESNHYAVACGWTANVLEELPPSC